MKLNLVLAKTFQFVVSLMFIAMVLFYVGVLLMFPLAVLWYAIKIAALIAPTVISVLIGIGVLGYLGLRVSQMGELLNTLQGIGYDLVELAFKQKDRFDPVIEQARAK